MIKLSKKLTNESIIYLQNFLKKKRKIRLSKAKVITIKALIEEKKRKNSEFAKEIINSPLCRLACIQVLREGKAKKIQLKTGRIYEFNEGLIWLKMAEIIEKTHQKMNNNPFVTKQKIDLLNNYLRGGIIYG